ncbi:MAG: hypothetical protein NVS3B25_33490 [Hymenobacter sp.]
MKSFLFWLLNGGLALLIVSAFCSAYGYHKSVQTTHAAGDALMYVFELFVLAALCYGLVRRFQDRNV